MSKLWLPGAEKVAGPHSAGGTMAGGNALCTHHITGTGKGTFPGTRDYLVRMGYEPTLILDPFTGARAQFLPANRSAYALEHPAGQPETNREGKIHVQIEWFWPAMPNQYNANDITKAPHFAEIWADLIPWLEDLGVPSRWTFGSPLSTSKDPKTWKQGGHRGHRNAPGNSHVDSLSCRRAPAWSTEQPRLQPGTRASLGEALNALNGRRKALTNRDDRQLVTQLRDAANTVLERT